MNIAYFLNTYPLPSTTFIRGEIEALRERGLEIERFAVRRFAGTLVDSADKAEMDATEYVMSGNMVRLFAAFAREIVTNPVSMLRLLPVLRLMQRRAYAGTIRHFAYLMQACYLRQAAASQGISHIHTHFGTNATAVALLSKLLGGPGYSFTAHGPDEFEDARYLSFDLKIKHAKFVVAISNHCRDLLADLARKEDVEKIVIERCGLRLDDFEVTPVHEDSQTLVCIGRLCPQKGQIHIPAAVAQLRAEFPEMKVVLVGDGESRAEIEAEIARHDVGGNVLLRGWASNAEVRQFLKDSRAMLLPSYAEGLPVAIMEALALNRPVISTTIAGIPELVDAECGWLIEPGNERQLADAIKAAMSTPVDILNRMGHVGRKRVEAQHDRRMLAQRLHRHFIDATRNGRTDRLADDTVQERAASLSADQRVRHI